MTALTQYARLESTGLWRADPDQPRREVVVAFGEATLVIADGAGRALSHWSLAAVERLGAVEDGAIRYAPGADATEALDLTDPTMIAAIDQVTRTVARAQARPGRLRRSLQGATLAVLALAALLWLPGALTRQTAAALPQVQRSEIGAMLLGHLQRQTGPACRQAEGAAALARLDARLAGAGPVQVVVLPGDGVAALALPGGIVALPQSLLAQATEPAVVAGAVLAALAGGDPLAPVLDQAGLWTTLRLLTTGAMPDAALADHAARLRAAPAPTPGAEALLPVFAAAGVDMGPWAQSLDPDGDSSLPLIEAAGLAAITGPAVLTDEDWIALQAICAF